MFSKRKTLLMVVPLIIIILVSIFGASSTFGDGFNGIEKPQGYQDDEGQLINADIYSQLWGVSIQEALNIFELQDSARLLEANLVENASDTFAGLWVEHSPKFKIVVALSANAKETVSLYLTEDISNVTEVRTVKYSYKHLQLYRIEFESYLKNNNIEFNSATDVMNNRVDIDIVETDKTYIDKALMEGKLYETDTIRINTVNALAKNEVDCYGGRALVGLMNVSTSGFSVKTPEGVKGVTTAGHQDNSFIFFYAFLMTMMQELHGGPFDIQWHHNTGALNIVNKIRYWSDGSTLDITSIRLKASQLIGETVSKYGDTTNYTAGTISAKDAMVDVPNCTPTYIKVYNAFGYGDLSAGGDSGGPWFTGNIAFGSHCAGDDANVYAYYMAVDYIAALGVSVMTSP